jgi:tRNA nucleotidyltransferase (CCA-adding enzyme)
VALKLDVRDSKPKPILQGRDLLKLGMEPGRKMGEVLQHAYEAQLDGTIGTLDEAIAWFELQSEDINSRFFGGKFS